MDWMPYLPATISVTPGIIVLEIFIGVIKQIEKFEINC